MSKQRTSWPQLRVLVPPSTFGQVIERAKSEGKPVSRWCREAIEAALQSETTVTVSLPGLIESTVILSKRLTINRLCDLVSSTNPQFKEDEIRQTALGLLATGRLKDGGLVDGERIIEAQVDGA